MGMSGKRGEGRRAHSPGCSAVRSRPGRAIARITWFCVLGLVTLGCTPRVKVEAPDKPIEINVNVKIEQEVRVKLDKAVERTLEENPELFGVEPP